MFTLIVVACVGFNYLVNSLFGKNIMCKLNKVLWPKWKRGPKMYLSKHETVLPLWAYPNTLMTRITTKCRSLVSAYLSCHYYQRFAHTCRCFIFQNLLQLSFVQRRSLPSTVAGASRGSSITLTIFCTSFHDNCYKKEVIVKTAPNQTAVKRDKPAAKLFPLLYTTSLIKKKINSMQLTSKSSLLSGNSCTCKIQPMEAEMKENQEWHRKFMNMNI